MIGCVMFQNHEHKYVAIWQTPVEPLLWKGIHIFRISTNTKAIHRCTMACQKAMSRQEFFLMKKKQVG